MHTAVGACPQARAPLLVCGVLLPTSPWSLPLTAKHERTFYCKTLQQLTTTTGLNQQARAPQCLANDGHSWFVGKNWRMPRGVIEGNSGTSSAMSPAPTLALVAALVPLSAAFGVRPLVSVPRSVQLATRTRCAHVLATEDASSPMLNDEQKESLLEASKSPKYYTALNQADGASRDVLASIRATYPALGGVEDGALNSAFAQLKRVGAGNRAVDEGKERSAFEELAMPQKVALVKAVKTGVYQAALDANAGVAADAWAAVVEDTPGLAGLSASTLEAAMASMPSEGSSRAAEGGVLRADNTASLGVCAPSLP